VIRRALEGGRGVDADQEVRREFLQISRHGEHERRSHLVQALRDGRELSG